MESYLQAAQTQHKIKVRNLYFFEINQRKYFSGSCGANIINEILKLIDAPTSNEIQPSMFLEIKNSILVTMLK